jgi:monoamine oxidase
MSSLATILSMTPAAVRKHVVAMFHHDWQNDPFSRGVYAYARVGGAGASGRLGAPIAKTLWFAGEATAQGGRSGTVDGALMSGQRAAHLIVNVLKGRRRFTGPS